MLIVFPAGPNGDYSSVTQTVTFPAGQTSQAVIVNTLEDLLAEGPETFSGALSAPNGNGIPFFLGAQDTATVDIVDNDCKISPVMSHMKFNHLILSL